MEKTLYDAPPQKYLESLAGRLKEITEFEMPEWAYFVKTSPARARPPFNSNWWLMRAASILRQLYTNGVVGVGRLRTKYGGKLNRGMRPKEFRKGSGKIIRVILQQAEKAGLIEKVKDKKAGRKLTKKGKELLDKTAMEMK